MQTSPRASTGGSPAESPTGSLSRFAGAPDRPVFVGACPRSGTTLLRTMLNSHPDLAVPRESRFLLEMWARRDAFGDLGEEAKRYELARALFTTKEARPGRVAVGRETGIARLSAAPPTLGSLLGTCFQMYAENQGKTRWGDKRPMYVQHLYAIFAMFPDAQFIHVVRDPRAVVASMRKLDWYEGRVAPAAELWDRSMRAADAWRPSLAPDQFLQVRYEDLASDPRATLEEVCRFLGLDPAAIDAMLAFHAENDVPGKSRYHWRVHQPVTTSSLDRWRDELDDQEIALVEHVAGRRLRRQGYEPVAGGAGPPAPLQRALRKRRARMLRNRLRRAAREARLRLTYRQPVAAQLTTGQRSLLDRTGSYDTQPQHRNRATGS